MQTIARGVLAALFTFTLQGFGAGFYHVHSPNGVDVWAVGNGGTVFHSVDGGVIWTSLTQGSWALRGVYSIGTNTWIAGDNGAYYSSTDGGATWSSQVLAGGATLRAVAFADAQTGWLAGNSGTILKTTNGGSSWSTQTSGTTQQLNALVFTDGQTGYAAGASGTLITTTNGGTTWTSSAQAGWTKEILSVSASGQTLYVAGVDGFCYKSTNEGGTWVALDFKTDTNVDVNDVHAVSATSAYFVGGGGFIRSTADAGASYSYGIHQLHAKLNDVFFYSSTNGWACGERNNAILRTTDSGANWQLPQGATVNHQWKQKPTTGTGSIGNTFCVNPKNKNVIYVVMGSTVYMSGDLGEHWSSIATITGGGSTWSFYVSPKDTNIWIAATNGGGKGVRRSTNHGATWSTTLLRNFTSYGMPLELSPDCPDTVIFAAEGTGSGPDGRLYQSTDFGATWDTLAVTSFRSPCDIVIVPGNKSLWYVGDGTTGSGQAQMWRSSDSGLNWTSIYSSSSSEIPMIAVCRLRNAYAFATAWASTSVTKSTNSGVSWSSIATTTSTWGVDIAKDDPNVVIYGTYGGSTSYLSTNAGTSFLSSPLTGSNSGMLAYDRATFLAHQASSGVWKDSITYTVPVSSAQAVTVISPNGGESWAVGSTQNINWTSFGITGPVKIELSTNGGTTFPTVLFASTTNDGTEGWSVNGPANTTARIRVSSVADLSIRDSSNANFSIVQPSITTNAPNGGEVWSIGSAQNITWTSNGVSGNVKIDLSTDGGVTFPTVLFGNTANDGSESWTVSGPVGTTARVRITSLTDGSIRDSSNGNFSMVQASITVGAPNGGENWNVGSIQNITWTSSNLTGNVKIELSTDGGATFPTVISTSTANDGTEPWVVAGPTTTDARVRISGVNNPTAVDESNSSFSITSMFALLTELVLRDNGGEADSLELGTGAGASDAIDVVFGEYELPPLPPLGVFDVRWRITGTQGTRRDVRDTLGGSRQQIVYEGRIQDGPGGYPFHLRWNRSELPAGTFTLQDGNGGIAFSVNMKQQDSLAITDVDVGTFQIVYDAGNTVYSTVQQGWNMVSLPVTMSDRSKTVVFPTSVSNAFAYTPGGYASRDTLEYGLGYWLKFPSSQMLSLAGDFITLDTIDVAQGWNIIGSISVSVPTGSIVQIPGGIVTSQYFGYTGGTYTSASSIDPMRAYWVKVSQNGKLVLTGSAARIQKSHPVHQK